MRLFSAVLLACACCAPILIQTRADEGFWPFDLVPRDVIERRFEFTVTDAWLEKARRASLRLSAGGSGAFVSPNGLVMTNRHVVAGLLQRLSVPGKTDLIRDGFLAKTQAEELQPGGFGPNNLRLEQLVEIVNVNDRVKSAAARFSGNEDTALQSLARDAQFAERNRFRIQGVKLYPEGEYRLYKFKVYTDVRLVFAADLDSGFFGGDTDNFMYPRYNFDVAFLRAYENGKPAQTPDYFPWSYKGAKTNELVFFTGNPGETDRSITLAHLEFERDHCLPASIALQEREAAVLKRYGELGAEQHQRVQDRLHSCENSLKRLRGQLEGLKNPEIFARKRAEEEAAAKAITDPQKAKAYADAVAEMRKAVEKFSNCQCEYELLTSQWGPYSAQLFTALGIARMEESGEYNFRVAEQQRSRMETIYGYDPARRDESERRHLEESLTLCATHLGPEHALTKAVLNGKSAAERAAELVAGTKLGTPEFYRNAERGFSGIDKSGDPMLMLAKKVSRSLNETRTRQQNEFAAVEKRCYAAIAHALSQNRDTRRAPDGNFTPRISFGTVLSYEEKGRRVHPFTCFDRLYAICDRAANQEPYRLNQMWLNGRYKLNPCTPLNFVTDADGYGGNSGSPVFNRNREIVGLLFDGNYPGLVGKYLYDERTKRSVCVDSRAVVEVLRNLYGAEALVKEFAP